MVLRFFILLLVGLFQDFVCARDHQDGLRNFRYEASVNIRIKQHILAKLSDIVSTSDIEEEISSFRTFQLQNRTVSSMHALQDRVRNDIKEMYKKAYSYGFYNAKIEHSIKFNNQGIAKVHIIVDLGRLFNVSMHVQFIDKDLSFSNRYARFCDKTTVMYKASMSDMELLLKMLVHELQKDGFVSPEITQKTAFVDYTKHNVRLNVEIKAGEQCRLGSTTINAFDDISTAFILNRIEWQQGELFNIDKIQATANNLRDTQLFSKVKIKPDIANISDGEVPMLIQLEKDHMHTIDLSLLYTGVQNMNADHSGGPRKNLKSIVTRLSWEKNNVFGNGEKFNVILEGTPMKVKDRHTDYAFEVTLKQPDVLSRNCFAVYGASRKQELTNVFFRQRDSMGATLHCSYSGHLLALFSMIYEKNALSSIYKNSSQRYSCLSVPIELIYDNTDDLLNPTKGHRGSVKCENMFFRNAGIWRLTNLNMSYSYHMPIDSKEKTVCAVCLKYNYLLQHSIDQIPIDKRLYAGGINSVRGFANQMAGELVTGTAYPFGGKRSLIFNAELRHKLSQNIGGVVFFDGAKIAGNTPQDPAFKLEKKRWFVSAGVGIRYFSAIGPIRVDFAFPMHKRRGVDSKMQFIMSIGQAF